MENNNILFLYGNAFEVMLPNQSFQSNVEEVIFYNYIESQQLIDSFSICDFRFISAN